MNVTKSFLETVKPDIKHLSGILNYPNEIYNALKENNLKVARTKMEEHLLDTNRRLSEMTRERKGQNS